MDCSFQIIQDFPDVYFLLIYALYDTSFLLLVFPGFKIQDQPFFSPSYRYLSFKVFQFFGCRIVFSFSTLKMFYCALLCYILCDMELAFLSLFFQIDFVIFTYDFFQLFLSLVLKQFDHNLLWYSFPCICFSSCLLNFLLCVLMVSVRSEYNFNSYHFFKYHSFHSICQTLVVMYGTGILISFSVFCLWCLSTGSSCNSFFFSEKHFSLISNLEYTFHFHYFFFLNPAPEGLFGSLFPKTICSFI